MKNYKIILLGEIISDLLFIAFSILAVLYGYIFAVIGITIFVYDLLHILMEKKSSFIGTAIKDILGLIP